MKNPLFICVVLFSLPMACQQEDFFSPSVESKENTADFVINNNSTESIRVTYVTSSKLGFKESESFISIPAESTVKIFDVVFIGEFPFPSSAFSSLSFYFTSSSGQEKILESKPVIDENWTVLDQTLDQEGFGYTLYQLSFSDLKGD